MIRKVNIFNRPASRQLLGLAIGFAVSTSAFSAVVTSSSTTSVMGRAPVMTAPKIEYSDTNNNGIVDVGDTLTATDGAITDEDGDTPIASTYRWNNGTADVGSSSIYTILTNDLGKKITLFATPHTDSEITDPADGIEVAGTVGSGGEIVVESGNLITGVVVSGYVSGNPQVGTELTATPTCLTTCDGTITYQWEIETAVNSGVYAKIDGATGNKYTPKGSDQRRMIRVVAENQ